jgi:Ca2+-binding EF-hand superfamily protein
MLYLYFANGKDKARISIAKFFDGLVPFTNDQDKQIHNLTAFRILDFDRDGYLNVVNLFMIFKNIPSNSVMGQEIFAVIDYLVNHLRN